MSLRLTTRQQEVLLAIARGLTDDQIGARLGVSSHTVASYVQDIFSVLGATNRPHAVYLACCRGWLPPDESGDHSTEAR